MKAIECQGTIPLICEEQYQRLQRRDRSAHQALWQLLDQVKDPEIPVVSIWDLGILQNIEQDPISGAVTVTITPTYSGCPAVDMMTDDIDMLLRKHGYRDCGVKVQLAPAWTTDWITEQGRDSLKQFGIAPPSVCPGSYLQSEVHAVLAVSCPQCGSRHTHMISEFGSTACKAACQCKVCGEAFDYFKPF